MNYSDLRKLNDSLHEENRQIGNQQEHLINSLDRTLGICEQSRNIVDNIEKDFLEKTKLQKNDIPFLFLATALQTVRWFLLPSLDLDFSQVSKEDRLKASEKKKSGELEGKRSGQRYEKPEINDYKKKHQEKYNSEVEEYRKKVKGEGDYKYLSWIEILFHAVPYDAMYGSENIQIKRVNIFGKVTFISPIGKQLNGKNHHVATLGHDPVLGWIFGTMNIASARITFCDLQTYPVNQSEQLDKWSQTIDYMRPSSIGEMIRYCIGSFEEDSKRLPAAIARQAIHIKSDQYTKDGLPIPLLPPDIAQKLIDKGWNSNEAERVLKKIAKNVGVISAQFIIAELINMIIRGIYLILNPPDETEFSRVKIEKILKISSIIAEGSNVAVVVATRNIARLDIGGLISMVHQITFDAKTRMDVEREFIKNEFERVVMEDV